MAPFSTRGPRKQASMKKILLGFLAFITLAAFTALSGLDDVIGALRAGNASELAKYIDDNVEITLPEKSDRYSRAQATAVLQDFFNNRGVKSFELKHKGDNGGSQFAIGTLQTRAGAFRTTVYMTTRNGRQLVREIRFQ
ncbi:DUF4783 domain-containing protein [Flaviaesturariibacter flavus]|uniref:DUF4783 domain-containing protein n=2 Tax=Flaviaesturariibacter flavus TaxID=2502780 RepID=A0A4R1BB97_9BACT|nr:DUF4783 domain-containing protein [Flaviaesturariibacter flavus]